MMHNEKSNERKLSTFINSVGLVITCKEQRVEFAGWFLSIKMTKLQYHPCVGLKIGQTLLKDGKRW